MCTYISRTSDMCELAKTKVQGQIRDVRSNTLPKVGRNMVLRNLLYGHERITLNTDRGKKIPSLSQAQKQ